MIRPKFLSNSLDGKSYSKQSMDALKADFYENGNPLYLGFLKHCFLRAWEAEKDSLHTYEERKAWYKKVASENIFNYN